MEAKPYKITLPAKASANSAPEARRTRVEIGGISLPGVRSLSTEMTVSGKVVVNLQISVELFEVVIPEGDAR